MHQRKEEEDQGYDTMDLQDGFGSWWDADSPGLDDDEEHSREWSQQSWRSYGGYQPREDWHRSQCAVEDLSVKFAEVQKYIGNITTQYSTFQTEIMLAIQALTHQQKQSVSVDGHGTAVAEQEASEGQSRRGRQPQKVADGAQRRRFVHRSVGPALGCAAGCGTRVALGTVQQLRLHMGMRHPQNGRALISRLSECTVVQWRHVASHTGNVGGARQQRRCCLGDWSIAATRDSRCQSGALSGDGRGREILDERHDEARPEAV